MVPIAVQNDAVINGTANVEYSFHRILSDSYNRFAAIGGLVAGFERIDSLFPAANAAGRRFGATCIVLGAVWRGLARVVHSSRLGAARYDLPRIFFPWRRRDDRPLHGDLLDDLNHRRSSRRIFARSTGGPRQLAPFMGLSISPLAAVEAALFLTLLAFTLTALGFLIAWPLDSTQGFHAIMSMFLLPMWLLSGAFFPAGESGWLSWVIRANPLTYGVAGLRRLLYAGEKLDAAPGLPAMSTCLVVTILFCGVCVAVSVWLAGRRSSRDAR